MTAGFSLNKNNKSVHFRFSLFKGAKNHVGILICIALKLYISLGRIGILTVLKILIHEPCMSLNLFGCSFFFFLKIRIL